MKYGDKFTVTFVDVIDGKKVRLKLPAIYRRTNWYNCHTDDEGNGLWCGDRQILGTCDFTVRGCSTEKAAKAKIRRKCAAWMRRMEAV